VGTLQLCGYTVDFLGARFVGGGDGLLPQVIETLSELVLRPLLEDGHFAKAYVESEKRHLRDAIRSRINHARSYARYECMKLLCEGEPHALPLSGEEDTLDVMSPTRLTAAWERLLREAAPTFIYVGNSEPARVVELLRAAFADRGGQVLSAVITAPPVRPPVRATKEMPITQGHLVMGYRTDLSVNHPLAAAMTVFNEIFGGSAASKLFLNVREKRSLCYHCASSLDLYKGTLIAAAGVKPENLEVAETAVRAELDAMLRGEISDVELHAAKRSLNNVYLRMPDRPSSLAGFYMNHLLVGDDTTAEERRAQINAVTREQLCEVALHLREGAVFSLRGTESDEEVEA
jgi:predicted Zn-dependent peptidase